MSSEAETLETEMTDCGSSGYRPADVAAASVVAGVIILTVSLLIGYRYGVLKTEGRWLKKKEKKKPDRFLNQKGSIWAEGLRNLNIMKAAGTPEEQLFGKPQGKVLQLTAEPMSQIEAEGNLLKAMEVGQITDIESASDLGTQHQVDEKLVKAAQVMITRLTDAYLGFDGPGAALLRATGTRILPPSVGCGRLSGTPLRVTSSFLATCGVHRLLQIMRARTAARAP
ncbi:hypothetical protein CYMTET_16334 [Cymbomonas tetramitiformis]|uniref:Uncharacterized protein n=1 Tax=Cymbomonas tetramitiformis TaxID=36881 RepID=A0AAE0GDM6_9CHLO|nr:hypothetical protein CYMTET_16334 [Cymbomonas tetramitiformis]